MKSTNKIKGLLLVAVLVLAALFGVACDDKAAATAITVTGLPENGVVVLTDTQNTLQLGATLTGGSGTVQWRSGDEDVATVDGSGKVSLIDSGAAVITATLTNNAEIKAEVLLTVKDERAVNDTITLSGMPDTNTAIYDEGSVQLSAACSNATATLVWISSNDSVATVNSSGLVTFMGGGSTDITVYKKGQRAVKATATLTVVRKVESLTIANVDSGAIVAGYDYRYNKTYSYALQTEHAPWNASPFELEWSVDNTSIAEIDENGVITGKQDGKVTVMAQVKGDSLKATKEFDVVKPDDKSEDFTYAVGNRCIVNAVCTDAWLDYTGPKVTSHNTDIFIDTYDTNKKMLLVEKNTDWAHWTHLCLGSWNLTPGKYVLTVDLEVTKGEFQGKISGAQYKNTPAEYEYGIRPDPIGELALGELSDFAKQDEDNKYEIVFELTQSYNNFGIMLYDDHGTISPYALRIKSFSLLASANWFTVETDIYSDGTLIMGEEYKFVPGEIEGCTYSYDWTGNGATDNEFIELKDGKLTPKKVGSGVKLTVSTSINGKPISKEYNLSVVANPFKENEDDYQYAVDVKNRGNLVYDVRRTSVYMRTHNWIMSVEQDGNGSQSLKMKKNYAPAWDGSVQFMLGSVKKGVYEVSFTLRGDVGVWDKFKGYIYPITLKGNWQTTFTKDGAYTRGSTPYGNIYDGVKSGNTYTYTITVEKDADNFGIELCGGTEVDYTVYLDAFKFVKLPDIDTANISGIEDNATVKSGAVKDLTATVTYENDAEKGSQYECEWNVTADTNGGSARIIDGENGKKQLQGLKPGAIVLTLTVTSATGKQITVTKNLTVELGELAIPTDMYSDNILVKGESYNFAPIPLIDGMTFVYKFKASDSAAETDTSDIVEVKDGKLIAKTAGTVKLIVSSSIEGTPISKTLDITVKEYGGTVDENYNDAINPTQHGDFFDIERTNVYLRTFNMKIEKSTDNKLTLTKNYTPAPGASILFSLGDVKAGRYCVTVKLGGDLGWDQFKGYLYAFNWNENWQTIFTDKAYTKVDTPYGNIHEAGFCLYSGSGNSTTGGTYTMYIDIATDQSNFGLMLETWESDGHSNTSFAVTLESFTFEKQEIPKTMDFGGGYSVFKYEIGNYGAGITVAGKDGSMVVTKAATSASITETGALKVVTPTAWSEIALCFGTVKAGTYMLQLDIAAVEMAGNYWFTGVVYSGTCKNGKITYDGTTGLLNGNAAEVTHAATSKTVTLTITVAEDTENFAIVLASKGDCGQAVNVQLSNISLSASAN